MKTESSLEGCPSNKKAGGFPRLRIDLPFAEGLLPLYHESHGLNAGNSGGGLSLSGKEERARSGKEERARHRGARQGGGHLLVTARPRYVAGSERGLRRCLDVTLLVDEPYRKAGDEGCLKVRKKLETVLPSIPAARAALVVVAAAIANAYGACSSSAQRVMTRCVS